MIFQIDFKSGTPVYLQLVDQVRYAAASGALKAADPLPTIRPLAEQLHLNRNTVAKAYTELESLGVVKTVPGKGCFLTECASPLTQKARNEILTGRIDHVLVAAHLLQVEPPALLELIQNRIQFFERKNAKAPKATPEPPPATSTVPIADLETWTPLTD